MGVTGTPRWLGRYEVLRPLGSGGMAEVFLARATGIEGFEKLVALKRMLPQHAADPTLVALFLEEARLAATLDHPNVVHVHDIGQEQGGYFFAMEFVHGVDGLRLLRAAGRQGKPVPLDVALTMAIGACAGLHHAHEKRDLEGQPRGIVHCDVSPSNLLATFDGAVKVTDFGIAKALRSACAVEMTAPRGKRGYMSPEQCVGAPLDRRSDVFSLGVVLRELVAGHSCPRELERIVLCAAAVAPADRYPTAEEMQLELEGFARDQRLAISPVTVARCLRGLFGDEIGAWEEARQSGVALAEHLTRTIPLDGATGDTTVPAAPRRRPRPLWPIAVALLALAAIAGGAAFALSRAGEEARPASPPAAAAPAEDPAGPVERAAAPAAAAPEDEEEAPARASSRSRRSPRKPRKEAAPGKPTPPAWQRDGLSTPP